MNWYSKVPKDMHENLRFRQFIYAKCKNNPALQMAVREVCKKDILFWVNTFLWTYDPRLKDKTIPFITYEFQDIAIPDIVSAIREGQWLVQYKSRDMGASWMDMIVFDWFCEFEDGCTFFVMSRNAALVDSKGDPNSLFWKIDEIHRLMPSWLRPPLSTAGYSGDRKEMQIHYARTRSVIVGGTTTKAAGIGGRATAALVDEYSRFDPLQARLIKGGLKDLTNCVIWPFTRSPEMGVLHPSGDLVAAAKKGDIRSMPLHWSQHPVKGSGLYEVDQKTRNIEILDKTYDFPADYKYQLDGRFRLHSPWFDEYRKGSKDRDVADNLEFDDDVGANTVFDAIKIREYEQVYSRDPYLVGDIRYDPNTGDFLEWFERADGPIKMWIHLDNQGKPPTVSYVAGVDTSLGVGTTNSCFALGRCDTSEKILEFVTPWMKPEAFAIKSVAICNWFNSKSHRVLLGWERLGPGDTYGNKVQELCYQPIYYHKNADKMDFRFTRANTPGYHPNLKRMLLDGYEASLMKGTFINRSREALEETLEFENTPTGPKHRADRNRKNDPSGATLNHGDRVIADAICDLLMRERGATIAQAKDIVQEGSLAWLIREEEIKTAKRHVLYPNWSRR